MLLCAHHRIDLGTGDTAEGETAKEPHPIKLVLIGGDKQKVISALEKGAGEASLLVGDGWVAGF